MAASAPEAMAASARPSAVAASAMSASVVVTASGSSMWIPLPLQERPGRCHHSSEQAASVSTS